MKDKLSQSDRSWRLIWHSVQTFMPSLMLVVLTIALYYWSTTRNVQFIPVNEIAIETASSEYFDELTEERAATVNNEEIKLGSFDQVFLERLRFRSIGKVRLQFGVED